MHETDFELAPECDPGRGEFWIARVEQSLGVISLAEFAAGRIGATRLLWGGGDTADCIISCVWQTRGLEVEYVEGFAWHTGESEIRARWRTVLPTGLLPRCLRNWRRVVAAFNAAPSCESELMGLGGLCCHHALWTEGRSVTARWLWPDTGPFAPQMELIRAYDWIRVVGRCRSWLSFI